MREFTVPLLILLSCLTMPAQSVPTGWKIIKDASSACQIAVPAEWVPLGDTDGAAVLQDATTAIAVVTSQPGQEFKPLSDGMLKLMGIPKEKVFENNAKRIFYQDRTSETANDPNGFSASVPAKSGTCSCRISVLPNVKAEVAKQIAGSLAAAAATKP